MEFPKNYFQMNEYANQCKRKWNINEYDPVDIFAVALNKIKNLTICFMYLDDELSGASIEVGKQRIVFINSRHTLGRQRFTLAHEIYHLKFDKTFQSCDVQSDDQNELNADQFASSLIMTHGAIDFYENQFNITKWSLDDIINAEQYYQISHKAMLKRLLLLEKITEEEYDEFISNIMWNATKRGYTTKLYEPYSRKKNLIIGNYVKLIQFAYENELITKKKREKFLRDGFCENLI